MLDFGSGNGEEGDRGGDLDMDITIHQGTEPARQSDKPATDVVDEVGKATTEVTTGANEDTVREGAQKAGTGESLVSKCLDLDGNTSDIMNCSRLTASSKRLWVEGWSTSIARSTCTRR